ncbi:hypothetical protein OSTOST_14122, partial [Ostertagia ostertagi]
MLDTRDRFISSHTARIERFIAKHFYNLVTPGTEFVARKHMKPFVQTSLQYKVSSRQLQEVTEDQMNLLQFSQATRNFIHSNTLFASRFSELSPDGNIVNFENFVKFLENMQSDSLGSNRSRVVNFLRRYDKTVIALLDRQQSQHVPNWGPTAFGFFTGFVCSSTIDGMSMHRM